MLKSPYPIPPILPPAEHPRLMLRKQDLARIRSNLNTQPGSTAVRLFRELCNFPIIGKGALPEKGTYHLKEYIALEAQALEALLEDDRQKGRSVIEKLLLLLRNVVVYDDYMQARFSGHLIFIASEVYDWCYLWLTEEECGEIIAVCESLAENHFEMGYPPSKQAAISGHGNEAQLLRDLLAFAIAIYDERPDVYHFCAGRLFTEYLPAYEAVFAGRFHPQGPCYGSYRYAWAMWFGLLIYSMSGEKILPPQTVSTADSFIYLRRSDGEALRLGDDYNETKALYTHKNPFFVPLFLAAAYSGDALWHKEAEGQLRSEYLIPLAYSYDYYDEGSCGEGVISPTVFLVWNGLSPLFGRAALPKAKYFGEPIGCTVYNDGERLILMKIGTRWGANHDHLDTGCFQIYDGEALITDSGVYDSYGTAHRKNYLIQTVAHNCLLVAGKGTRVPCDGKEPKTLSIWCSDYEMATVLRHEESDDRYLIEGDLSKAYEETCHSVTRRMCWEPNRGDRGILTVTDTVVPQDETAPVTFLLHTQSDPEISENTVRILGKERDVICRIRASGALTIRKIGGEGHQFLKDGINYEPSVQTSEEGYGRVEITTQGAPVTLSVEMEICKK